MASGVGGLARTYRSVLGETGDNFLCGANFVTLDGLPPAGFDENFFLVSLLPPFPFAFITKNNPEKNIGINAEN
jgi:hypothetical protein